MGALLKIGVVTAAHGIKGQVKIRSFTDNPADLTAYGPLLDEHGAPVALRVLRAAGETTLIAALERANTREAAEALKGFGLFIPADALPAPKGGAFYTHDLVGLRAVNETGAELARVAAVENYGAGDLLELEFANGTCELYPFTERFFGPVDMTARTILFFVPEVTE